MKQYKTFDELLEILKKVKPPVRLPEELTNKIMYQLPKRQQLQKKGIRITDNSERWIIFIGFRNVATFAALFLIGFFAYQQWEIMSKISTLENEVYHQNKSNSSFNQIKNSSTANLRLLIVKQLKSKDIDFVLSEDEKELLTVSKNTLNLLNRELELLEDDNIQLKASAIHQFLDSLNSYNHVRSKYKSL